MARAFTVAYSGRVNHPRRTTAAGWRNTNCASKALRRQAYQGMPLRFGAFEEGSGRSPALRISAMSRTPVNPPPTNAANTHHNETTCCPRFLWFREIARDLIQHPLAAPSIRPIIRCARSHLPISEKNPALRRTVSACFGKPPERHNPNRACDFEGAGTAGVLLVLELDSLRPLKKLIKRLNTP